MAVRVLGRDHPDADTFRIRVEKLLPVAIVALDGELTLSVVARVRNTILRCLAECPDAVIVDLARLSVESNLPLNVFRAARRHAATWPAVPLLLCSPPRSVLARLARSGLGRIIPIYLSRAVALAAAKEEPAVARTDLDLPPTLGTPAQARDLIGEVCRAWGLPELVDDARLIVSELVTNAVIHVRRRLRLSAVLRYPDLHLIVRDQSTDPPLRRTNPGGIDSTVPSGRGLYLLDVTADSWGHLTIDTGKVVWAVLRRR